VDRVGFEPTIPAMSRLMKLIIIIAGIKGSNPLSDVVVVVLAGMVVGSTPTPLIISLLTGSSSICSYYIGWIIEQQRIGCDMQNSMLPS
jgi:hypothetical protein